MRVAVVTGASSGIGRAVATELHRRGWSVGVTARREDPLIRLCDELGERCAFAVTDVCDREQTAAAIEHLENQLGPIDLMIANAGIGLNNPAFRFDYEAFERTLNTNVFGVVHSVMPVLDKMIARESGHIAVVSSVAAYRGLPRTACYSASKAAISTLFEGWGIDLLRNGVKMTAIHPGYVQTPILGEKPRKLPWLMSSDRAARIIVNGLERGKTRIVFPWQMRIFMGFMKLMPDALYRTLIRRIT